MKRQKKMAVINDFSGFGRCSLTVSLPVISAMKIECCALPTAVFSNHTGYCDYFFDDYTDKMQIYYSKWQKLGLEFDGIYTGFLGSVRQIQIVTDFINHFSNKNTTVIIDPVMGDNGCTYATYNDELCRRMKDLVPLADIITPNITEACILSDTPYSENISDEKSLLGIAQKLHSDGCKNIIITGINDGKSICNFVYENSGKYCLLKNDNVGQQRAGTGDVFASIIAADAVNGTDLITSVKKAADFVSRAIKLSDEMNIPSQEGVCFEEILNILMQN